MVQNQALCQVLTGKNGLVFSWEAENLFWLLSFNFFYWSLIALQFCVTFCCTTTWISIRIQIPLPLEPSPHTTPSRSSKSTDLSSLCYTQHGSRESRPHFLLHSVKTFSLGSNGQVAAAFSRGVFFKA